MPPNILVTGAAGYIGGSVLDQLLQSAQHLKGANLYASVRSQAQIELLSKLQVVPILLDTSDEQAVRDAVLQYKIDILINTVASFHPVFVRNMIMALGEQRKDSGQDVYFIHSGVMNVFSAEAGWPFGAVKDSDAVYQKEKEWVSSNPVRETDVLIVELAKAHKVTSVNVVVPHVYGRGSGEGRKLSVFLPANIRTSIVEGIVRVFDEDSTPPYTHISDLAALYVLLVRKILEGEDIPTVEDGYYFAMAHRASQREVMQRITSSLHQRGLVSKAHPHIWASDEEAAEKLGFPLIQPMAKASGQQIAVNPFQLGWEPKWSEESFLDNLDDEVQAVLDLDTVKATIFNEFPKH